MRFFCLSDTHGQYPEGVVRRLDGQVILHAGDFYNEGIAQAHPDWDDIISRNDILVVRGNHDCVKTDLLDNHDLSMGLCRAGDVWVVGLGWCGHEYHNLAPEALMTKHVLCLLDACTKVLQDGDRTVLVTHYPPQHKMLKNWEGWEFKCITSLIHALRPQAVVAGHRHGMAGRTLYQDDVPIVFPGPKGCWLDVSEEGVKIE